MKSKKINYFLLLSSIFFINGCGNASTSDNTPPTEGQEEASYFTPDTSTKTKGITSGSRNLYKVTQSTVLEDAEDGETNGWRSYDNTPSSVSISNVYDNNKGSNVIELKGAGVENGALFSLENATDGKTLKWSMNFNEEYVIYVRLDTAFGIRYIYYTPVSNNYGKSPAPYDYYIHHGLGTNSKNGTWQTFSRDLSQDLKEFEPSNDIFAIEGLYIRGSGRIDDINIVKTETDDSCIGYLALKQKIDNNEDVTQAKTSCITDMSGLFSNNHTFNQDIRSWDVSNVTNMAWMFSGSQAFNQDISSWDVSKVTNMEGIFNHAYNFNQSLNSWNVSNVTNMAYMFTHAKAFNRDLSSWDVSKVRDMKFMFEGASNLTNRDFSSWNITANDIDHEGFISNTGGENIEPNWNNNPTITIEEALKTWVHNNKTYYGRPATLNDTPILSSDKTHAVIHLPSEGHEPAYYIFLDISDIDNIKELNTMSVIGRSNAIHFQKMKEGDYVLFSTVDYLSIYDYNTGEHLSDSHGVSGEPPYYLTVDRLEDNYAIVSRPRLPDNKMTTYKIDFTDRRNPITTVVSDELTLSDK